MRASIGIIKNCILFEKIKDIELERMLDCLDANTQKYKPGQFLYLVGHPISAIGIVLSGSVQIIKEDFVGTRMILAELGRGELFGETFACAETKESPVTVIAREDSEVLWLRFKRVITTCPSDCPFHRRLIENLVRLMAEKNILLNEKITILSKRSIREKCLTYLVTRANHAHERTFQIPFSRNELADYLCVDRSALSRELSKLRDEGVLDYEKNTFTLLQYPML